jgi:uncharacterized lipoprotein YbaY
MNTASLVKGEITFEAEAPPFTGATMYVRLENVTVADTASEVIAEYVERNVAFDPKTTNVLSFAIPVHAPDARTAYAVRVHIDIDGDGEVSPGDFISTQSYPVLTFGHPRDVAILVRQVR